MGAYTCYLLHEDEKAKLEKLVGGYAFPSRRADHVTVNHAAENADDLPRLNNVLVYGFASDLKGIEAFLVEVNGERKSPDGRYYHMTWSLNPKQSIPALYEFYEPNEGVGLTSEQLRYESRHSNAMLRAAFEDSARFVQIRYFAPVLVGVTPAFVIKDARGHKTVQRLTQH